MRRRRGAGDAVCQDLPETGARLDPGVPVLGRAVLLPRDIAQIVDAGQVRRGAEIGEAEVFAGEPTAPFDQPFNIGEMGMRVAAAGQDGAAVRFAVPEEPFHDLFINEVYRDLVVELSVEPVDQTAHFRPCHGALADKRRFAVHFVEIFADRLRSDHPRAVFVDQQRHFTHRVERQEGVVAFPGFLNLQFEVELLFAEDQPDLAAKGRQPKMVQKQHGRFVRSSAAMGRSDLSAAERRSRSASLTGPLKRPSKKHDLSRIAFLFRRGNAVPPPGPEQLPGNRSKGYSAGTASCASRDTGCSSFERTS